MESLRLASARDYRGVLLLWATILQLYMGQSTLANVADPLAADQNSQSWPSTVLPPACHQLQNWHIIEKTLIPSKKERRPVEGVSNGIKEWREEHLIKRGCSCYRFHFAEAKSQLLPLALQRKHSRIEKNVMPTISANGFLNPSSMIQRATL
jgi:hypothetical protein